MSLRPGEDASFVVIHWVANPFRGDKFEETWAAAAEAVIRFGAHAWAFTRSKDDPLSFMQLAVFDTKLDFERYWYSDEIAEYRIKCAGLYQVPLLPTWYRSVGFGVVSETIDQPEAA
jgi:hypothetical protein